MNPKTRLLPLVLAALSFAPLTAVAKHKAAIPPSPASADPSAPITIVLDTKSLGRTFEGIGALSAGGAVTRLLIDYPEPQRSEILDYLFKPNFGAALQHLKVEIGGDINSTLGTEPSIARTREEFTHPKPEYFNRGYEWWVMEEAKKRNPNITFDVLQWGAPGWIGDGKFYSQDNADFVVAFIKSAKKYHDLDISYCGCWNETPCSGQWLKLLRDTLDTNGLKQVKIVAPDSPGGRKMPDAMVKSLMASKTAQVFGTHYQNGRSTAAAIASGLPLWSSEDGPWSGEWNPRHNPSRARLAKAYNRNYINGQMTKTIIWCLITSYYHLAKSPSAGLMRANEPWCGYYDVQPAIWMTAHTTQFIQPGWKYLAGGACAMLSAGGSHVAAVSPDGKDLSLIIETLDTKVPQHLSFKIAGNPSLQNFHLWRSTEHEQFMRLDDVPVVNGAIALNVEPEAIYSLTTTNGQCKGVVAKIPSSRPFPLPYQDDFEGCDPGTTPKYFTDFYGAFEAAARSDGGKCFKQIITRPGIPWNCGDHEPLTLIGSPAWRDYEISCDLCFDFKQFACLYARIGTLPRSNPPPGCRLRFSADGAWQLAASDKQLLAGKLAVVPGQWRRAGLRLEGNQITVLLDGKEAGSVTAGGFASGLAGLGCGYEEVKFDNLRIDDPHRS